MKFLNNSSSKTTVSSVANFITAYQESIILCFQRFIIFPCPCAVNMYKIMILLNNSSETIWPISTKFHIDPTVEIWFRVCSNDHTLLTAMPIYIFFKTKNCLNDDPFISCSDRIGKMLHNICISAVAMSLRWASHDPWAFCLFYNIW